MKTMFGKCLGTSVLFLGLLLASGLPAAAKSSHTIKLDHAVVLQGANLPAGRYQVEWQTHSPEADVQFSHKGGLVVSTTGRVEQRDQRYYSDAIVYGETSDGFISIVEIRFAGSKNVLVFAQ